MSENQIQSMQLESSDEQISLDDLFAEELPEQNDLAVAAGTWGSIGCVGSVGTFSGTAGTGSSVSTASSFG
jgi:hypothetical protein